MSHKQTTMRKSCQIAILLFCAGCSLNENELEQYGEATFRITLNYGRELTDAEIDSNREIHILFISTQHVKIDYITCLFEKGLCQAKNWIHPDLIFQPSHGKNPQ